MVQAPNAIGDAIVVSLLYVAVGCTVYALYPEPIMLAYYILGIGLVGIAVVITKTSFRVGGKWFSRIFLNHLGDPLKKKTTMKKWCDQSWQLAIHVSMACTEYYLLLDETWWQDTNTMWVLNKETGLCNFGGYKFQVKLFFIAQMSIWTYTAFSCKYLEEVRKDYFVMMTHHVVTVVLVAFCYILGYLNMGLCLLFLHDLSDIPLDVLKMVNYAKLGGLKGLFITEITFVVLLIDWFYFRVYLLPTKLMYASIVDVRIMCPPLDDSLLFPKGLPAYFMINSLLLLLWFLHIWWAFLILRLLVGIFTKGSHQTAEDEYEGESSDSDNEGQKRKRK